MITETDDLDDAPVHFTAEQASGWLSGWNAAVRAMGSEGPWLKVTTYKLYGGEPVVSYTKSWSGDRYLIEPVLGKP
jgi:hypothetical protein